MTRAMAKAAPSRTTKSEPTTAAEPAAAAAEEAAAPWGDNGEAMEAVGKANGALASGMTAIGQEVMTFANRRFGENVARTESLMQCKDPEQVFSLSVDFAQKAASQYLEEANRILELSNQVTRACWAPLEEQTRKALRDMNDDGK